MKKITKVVLAAALVLLVAGAFTGAAAAAGPVVVPVSVVTAEAHIQVNPVPGAEIHAASGLEDASAPILKTARVIAVEKTVKKGQRIPLNPFVPKVLLGTSMPVIKRVHHTESRVITL